MFSVHYVKKNIQTDDIEIAIYQNNHKMSTNTKTLWCDESCEKWYNYELFAKNQKNGTTIITMSRELYIKSNFEEIKLEWERLHELQTDGICTDFPNELKKFVDG